MPSLLLVVFILQLAIHLVNTVGAAAINNLLWVLYNKLPTSTSADVKTQTILRREVVRLKREMNATSSQDQFAKWAKLRRQHDKAVAEYDEKTQSLKAFKASFDSTISIARWLGTNGLRTFLQFWFSRQPMFWLPKGWVPWYVEWILAFPRAPTGSISIQVWGIACGTVVRLASTMVVALWVLVKQKREGPAQEKEAMKMDGRGGGQAQGEKVESGGKGAKKEL